MLHLVWNPHGAGFCLGTPPSHHDLRRIHQPDGGKDPPWRWTVCHDDHQGLRRWTIHVSCLLHGFKHICILGFNRCSHLSVNNPVTKPQLNIYDNTKLSQRIHDTYRSKRQERHKRHTSFSSEKCVFICCLWNLCVHVSFYTWIGKIIIWGKINIMINIKKICTYINNIY